MAFDIRPNLSDPLRDDCEIISGSVSDSALPGAGLIFTRGTVLIKYKLDQTIIGLGVPFPIAGIPRDLYILGASYDPATDITTAELGCKLTYFQYFQEDVELTALDFEPLFGLNAEDAKKITLPIKIKDIADYICSKLGVFNGLFVPDDYFITRASVDMSGGIVSVLNDIALSLAISGYVHDGMLKVSSTQSPTVVKNIIEYSPLSIGAPVPDDYIVAYNQVKIQPPEKNPDSDTLNWEKQESYGLPTVITIDNPVEPFIGGTAVWLVPDSFQYKYAPYTLVETSYDSFDRVVSRVTTERSIVAALSPGYIQHLAGKYVSSNFFAGVITYTQRTPPEGSQEVDIITTESFTYKVKAPSVFEGTDYPEGYEEIVSEETVTKEPLLKLTASTNVYSMAGQANIEYTYGANLSQRFVSERRIRTFEVSKGLQGQQISKTYTEQYLCQAYTQVGQQLLADAIQKIGERSPFDVIAANTLFANAQVIKHLGSSVEINSGREIGLQQRPPQAERTQSAWNIESKAFTFSGRGGGASMGRAKYTMPYSPDDYFGGKSGDTYIVKKVNAVNYATNFGATQHAQAYGIRNGANIKCGLLGFCYRPNERVVIIESGRLLGYGITSNTSYVFDSNGIIATSDILGKGLGSTELSMFSGSIVYNPPVPSIAAAVPDRIIGSIPTVSTAASPQTALNDAFPDAINGDGVIDLDTRHTWEYEGGLWVDRGVDPVDTAVNPVIVPLYDTRVDLSGATITRVAVSSLPYALNLLTQLAVTTRTALAVTRILKVEVPAADVSVAGLAPAVSIGVALRPPAADVAAAGAVPAVSTATVVQVPAADVAVAGATPTIDASLTVVLVPAANVTVAGVAPDLQAGDDYYTNLATQFFTLLRDWRVDWWGD